MSLLSTLLFATSSKDKTSIVGRFVSFRLVFTLVILAIPIFLFIAPLVLRGIAPGYAAVEKYSAIKRCSPVGDTLTGTAFEQLKSNTAVFPPSCEAAKEGGILYCDYSEKKGYYAPKDAADDQRYICPLLVNANGIPDVPRVAVSAGTQQMIITGGILVMLTILYFTFTSTRVVNNPRPMA